MILSVKSLWVGPGRDHLSVGLFEFIHLFIHASFNMEAHITVCSPNHG